MNAYELDEEFLPDAVAERVAARRGDKKASARALLARVVSIEQRLAVLRDFNEDQPRDDHGRWEGGGGESEAESTPIGERDMMRGQTEQRHALSKQDVREINAYCGNDYYSNINNYLRFGDKTGLGVFEGHDLEEEMKGHIAGLDSVLGRMTTPGPTDTYRGLNSWPGIETELTPGAVITDKGYVSTTYDRQHAAHYTNPSTAGGARQGTEGGYMMSLHVPAGTNAFYATPLLGQGKGNEHELVLARNSRIEITSIDHGSRTISARVLK